MKKIFICYRRVDEPYAATLIDQVLVPRFGSDMVFRASRSIRVGDDFEEKIFEAIRAASVLLVVIGPHWLDARGEEAAKAITQIAEILISSMIKSGESMARGNSGMIVPDKSQVPTGVSAYDAGDFV